MILNTIGEKCENCDFQTSSKFLFFIHNFTEETKPDLNIEIQIFNNTFCCPQCSYKSKQRYMVRNHIITQHLPDVQIKWLKCVHCSYKARTRKLLHAHVIKHIPKNMRKVFYCDQCSYKTVHKSCIRSHAISHMPKNMRRLFYCDQCSYKTVHRSCIRYHKLHKHMPDDQAKWFKCAQCTYKSKDKPKFTNHIILVQSTTAYFHVVNVNTRRNLNQNALDMSK